MSTRNDAISLQPPTDPPEELRKGPIWSGAQGESFFRLAHNRHAKGANPPDPWFFCICRKCRFDLNGLCGHGTCYIANNPITAVLEVLDGDFKLGSTLSEDWFDSQTLWIMEPAHPMPSPHRIADLLDRWWRSKGVTRELFSITPYDIPHQWAEALHESGFTGLRVEFRHDSTLDAWGIALFGEVGSADSDVRFSRQATVPMTSTFFADFTTATGIEVLPTPSTSEDELLVHS